MHKNTILTSFRQAFALVCVIFSLAGCSSGAYYGSAPIVIGSGGAGSAQKKDGLTLWNDGDTKKAILDYVARITDEKGEDFIPEEQRIAVFDNDGTLWGEQPPIWGLMVQHRMKQLITEDPALAAREPYKSFLTEGLDYLDRARQKDQDALLAATYTGMTQKEFNKLAKDFFASEHPVLEGSYRQNVYAPMRELLTYLADNGFTNYIVTGGDVQLVRAVAQEFYGIPPERVIGSSWKIMALNGSNGTQLFRLPEVEVFTNKDVKPVMIDRHIGRIPVFGAGNDGNAGDIAMLRYVSSNPLPNFSLLVMHDDAKRERAYGDRSGASVSAAQQGGWQLVSMAKDWKQVFTDPPEEE